MRASNIKIGSRHVPCQDISAYIGDGKSQTYLRFLLSLTTAIERATGHLWYPTSFIRASPNHQYGCALDIAPSISPDSRPHYAVTNGSDPVLYKRVPLIRALQRLAGEYDPFPYKVGIFIEPDHLHLQLFQGEGAPEIRVAKWKQEKEVYADTRDRMQLPLTCTGYSSHFHQM